MIFEIFEVNNVAMMSRAVSTEKTLLYQRVLFLRQLPKE